MLADGAPPFRPAHPQVRQCAGEGLPGVLTLNRQLEAVAEQAEADMEEDKKRHDQRVTADGAILDALDELDILAVGQRLVLHQETAHDEIDDANQHAHRRQVGQEAIKIAQDVVPQEGDGEQGLQDVAEIDQEVEDEAD